MLKLAHELALPRAVVRVLGALLLGGMAAIAQATPPPESIYLGLIRTMDSAKPVAEAVAVRGESIVAVGSRAAVMALRGRGTAVIELGSRAMLPGFIDAHGHLTATAAYLQFANLASPPVGRVQNVAELQETLRQFIRERAVPAGQWVIGVGYDDSLLAERRHPTRFDLDAVSVEHPIQIVHVSGHFSAANSKLLALAGITADSPDPAGGVVRRQSGSREPDGVLEETAHQALSAKAPKPDVAQSLANLTKALDYYASHGITTVQDGGSSADNLKLLTEAARRNLLTSDVVAYRFWAPVGSQLPDDLPFGQYANRLKIGGVKIVLDGSPQGKTAYLSEPYRVPPAGQSADYRGYPAMPAAAVAKALHAALASKVPLLAHANGDAAAQMLIDAVEVARRATGNVETKVVMIHAQTVRDDQLDRMARLNIIPSFFVGHTYYWGDWHRDETLGVSRAERISPTRSAIERGLPFTLHTDTPVVPSDMGLTLWSATTRLTRSGKVLGPSQRLTAHEALQGLTVNAAAQYSEQDYKGSIVVGKQADFVILSGDPFTMTGEQLRQLQIEETISRGKTIYRKPLPSKQATKMNWQQLKKVVAFYGRFTLSFTQVGYRARSLTWPPLKANFSGQKWLVTGASSGLGLFIAQEAARRGAHVTIAARNPQKLAQAVADSKALGIERIDTVVCDFSLQSDTARLLRELLAANKKFDVLINNVGVLNDEHLLTSEGREASFTINFLSHYLLTEGLIRGGAFTGNRPVVINMTSGGSYNVPLSAAMLNVVDPTIFNGTAAYAFHKRGQIVLNQFWRNTYGPKGFTFYVMHPGWADTEGVKRSLPRFRKILKSVLRDSASGGDTAIWLAGVRPAQPEAEAVWFDRKLRPAHVYERTRVSKDTPQSLVAYLDKELARFPESTF